jgi:hypothetical protein
MRAVVGRPRLVATFVDERRIVAGDVGAECEREMLIQSPLAARLRRRYALQSVERPATRVASFAASVAIVACRWALRLARLALRTNILIPRAPIAAYPSRCARAFGSFVDERRAVAGDEGAECGRETRTPSSRAMRLRTLRGSVGRWTPNLRSSGKRRPRRPASCESTTRLPCGRRWPHGYRRLRPLPPGGAS